MRRSGDTKEQQEQGEQLEGQFFDLFNESDSDDSITVQTTSARGATSEAHLALRTEFTAPCEAGQLYEDVGITLGCKEGLRPGPT